MAEGKSWRDKLAATNWQERDGAAFPRPRPSGAGRLGIKQEKMPGFPTKTVGTPINRGKPGATTTEEESKSPLRKMREAAATKASEETA
jgi:hypothetical protein